MKIRCLSWIVLCAPLVACSTASKPNGDDRRDQYMDSVYAIESELKAYYLECGAYPTTAQGLKALIETPKGVCPDRLPPLHLKSIPKDPFQGEWIYTSDGKTFELKSLGKDQKPGGDKENADQTPKEIYPEFFSSEPPTDQSKFRDLHYARLTVVQKMERTPITKQNADKFADQAKKLLAENSNLLREWSYQFSVHHGNLLLGRVELFKKNLEGAKKHLMKSADVPLEPKAPQLSTIGPNMILAKELLQAGEKKAVLAYLDACKKFWEMENGLIEKWKKDINEGKIPDFGHNLKT